MSSLYRYISECCLYENVCKITAILEAYGVDYKGNSTLLGEGSYKETHKTNIDGVVLFITRAQKQLDNEMFALELLGAYGYPVMEYYCSEKIGQTIIVLGKALQSPTSEWEYSRRVKLEEKVQQFLRRMVKDKIKVDDLQFMVDADDNPVFNDPLDIMWSKDKRRDAICKDTRSPIRCVNI